MRPSAPNKAVACTTTETARTVWYESEAYGIRRDAKEGLYKALVELALIPGI